MARCGHHRSVANGRFGVVHFWFDKDSALTLNSTKLVLAALISMCFAACSTPSETYVPRADGYSFSLDQDTPGGKFSSWISDHPSANGRISASVTVKSPRPALSWAPFVAMELCATKSCDDVGRLEIGFQPEGIAKIKVRSGGHELGDRPISGAFKIGEAVKIDLEWRGSNYMEVRLNGAEAQRLDLPFSPTAVRIISGSADVEVTEIAIQ